MRVKDCKCRIDTTPGVVGTLKVVDFENRQYLGPSLAVWVERVQIEASDP